MARKLRTGFELPFSNSTGSNQSKTFTNDSAYLFNSVITGTYGKGNTTRSALLSGATPSDSFTIYHKTTARTLSNGTRGCTWGNNESMLYIDTSLFSSGFFSNFWFYNTNSWNNNAHYLTLLAFYDGTDSWFVNLNYNSGSPTLEVYKHGTGQVASVSASGASGSTWYNVIAQINNAGDIDVSWNGTSVTYSTGVAFSNVTKLLLAHTSGSVHGTVVDDLSINDGSGASDNSAPNSIRGYNFFDAATLNTNSGFSAVGGTTVLANLQDGSDSIRVQVCQKRLPTSQKLRRLMFTVDKLKQLRRVVY